ncbi:protein SHI RELATED SEQUENCE 1-like [Cynara cardunculus var. scolymus]|uniref:Lateral Root Primordium type 1, C-terminal n=1 Tax=Cynara cardunculus var. scolymus TaxID=59895 RepID=A0A103YCF6_CYNCS|nr:protein SHI RELATED SEQUENCE 1-like [Cynara cardunculus var. scolymus]KVI06530.1 Lateral Root Primordium type 1, C-terminal [Cynara cardunculus var. scolymus]
MRPADYVIGGGSGSGSGGGSGGVINCQDCGNQAKKDCQHMRCRTCCRSRGLPCKTHVKSTWVPAAKRRERQQQLDLSTQPQNVSNQPLSLMMRSGVSGLDQNPKRPRDDHQQIAGDGGVVIPTIHHHNITPSGFHFPAELNSPVVFRCVRVSGTDETEEQLAYQTAVSVGGHVFNGILYDHGPDDQGQYNNPIGESSSVAGAQHEHVNLVTRATTTTTRINPAVTILDPSSMYTTPLSTYLAGGTQFFPPPRS